MTGRRMNYRITHNLQATRWIVQAFRSIREARGWVQQDVADELGVRQSTVASMETRGVDFQFSSLIRWAEALGVEVSMTILDKTTNETLTIPLTGEGAREVDG